MAEEHYQRKIESRTITVTLKAKPVHLRMAN
jgi:hypothetical protein